MPYTPGFTGDLALAGALAEIGIGRLMFGVGLHFPPCALAETRGVALLLVVGTRVLPWCLSLVGGLRSRERFSLAVLVAAIAVAFAAYAVVMLGKAAVAWAIARVLGQHQRAALTMAAALAQIGEVSFILAGPCLAERLLPVAGRDRVLAAALPSIALNPALFRLASRLAGPRVCQAQTEAPDRL